MDSSREITAHDLRLLSIGYYIQAGLCAFYSLLVFGYLGFFGAILAAAGREVGEGRNGIPPGLIPLITTIAAILVCVMLGYSACLFLSAYWIKQARNKTFIFVVAALTCLGIPYGTVLGIFTFIVLQRPVAKQFFSPGTRDSAESLPLTPPAV